MDKTNWIILTAMILLILTGIGSFPIYDHLTYYRVYEEVTSTVYDKECVNGYYTTNTHLDSKGNLYTTSDYHPPKHYVKYKWKNYTNYRDNEKLYKSVNVGDKIKAEVGYKYKKEDDSLIKIKLM